MEYSNKQKKFLFDRISSLSATEHEEILKIIKTNGVCYSQNKNGIFFNLSTLPDNVVKDIDNFVMYCVSNKKELDAYDKILNECKMTNNISGISPSLTTTLTKQAEKESWMVDDGLYDKFMKFVDKFALDKEKINKKKINVKYNNARKRFLKKSTVGSDLPDVLQEEVYTL